MSESMRQTDRPFAMSSPTSHVTGSGWGAEHEWRRVRTIYRCTEYRCERCGWVFTHNYPRFQEIFKAMYLAGVPDGCNAGSVSSAPQQQSEPAP